MKTKILKRLKESDSFVSGETISEELGITRSAVWKNINLLRSEGYVIDSVRNKGYRLVSSPDVPDEKLILEKLHTNVIGKKLIVLKSVDSTNDEAKRLTRSSYEDGVVIVALKQLAGKGRMGRKWSSDEEGGLYFSFILRPELPPSDIASITLASGYAVCLAIREYTGIDARIKWPNDIIAGNKKLCGILTEMAAQSDRIDYVVTGIGINVNNASFPDEIRDKATSLRLETGRIFDRSDFLASVLNMIDKVMSLFLVSLSTDDMDQFKTLCATLGREVSVKRGNTVITGIASDISASGELIVKTDSGEINISSGEVTVQGIY